MELWNVRQAGGAVSSPITMGNLSLDVGKRQSSFKFETIWSIA